MSYEVFISAKTSGADGAQASDSRLAMEVFRFLTGRGMRVFLSTVSLKESGKHAFKKAIDAALDSATVLVAVGTSPEALDAPWVRYEWDGFFSDILSEGKKEGRVFTYIQGFHINDLPRALRTTQVFQHDPPDSLEALLSFIRPKLPPGSPGLTDPPESYPNQAALDQLSGKKPDAQLWTRSAPRVL